MELRNCDEFNQISKLAEINNTDIFGIKGTCCFTDLLNLPAPQAPLDYMHLVLQGHARWIIRQFFFSEKKNGYNICNFLITTFKFKFQDTYYVIIFE